MSTIAAIIIVFMFLFFPEKWLNLIKTETAKDILVFSLILLFHLALLYGIMALVKEHFTH